MLLPFVNMHTSYLRHFILTRFNLLLWNNDREGNKVRSKSWLCHRFILFERYCLPSIQNQTCKDFTWIVLLDSTTPDAYKVRMVEYQRKCPQLIPVYVEPEKGRYFSEIFRREVVKRVQNVYEISRIRKLDKSSSQQRVLTTYLDNDDALNARYVEDVQRRAIAFNNKTFITYDNGYQLFTDYNYVMWIRHPRNHFMSVVESGNLTTLKTIYGYGSHYYIEQLEGVKIEHVKTLPMWCEVIHEKNMDNDAYFLRAKMVKKTDGFGFMFKDSKLRYGIGLYLFRFLPRYTRTYIRRVKYFFVGRHW